jgi:integrase
LAIQRRKLKDRFVYRVLVRDIHGEWYPVLSFDTKQEAKDHEAELITQRNKGVKGKSNNARELIFTDYWNQWKDECRLKASEGWKTSQDQMFRDHIQPVLGAIKLLEIDKQDILKLLSEAKKKGLGAQMQIHIFNLTHKMLGDAVECDEYRESNPALSKFKPDPPVIERPFYKPEQAKSFLSKITEHRLGVGYWIMTLCGLRCAEMQALQIGDIHLDDEDPYILVQRQVIRKEKGRIGPLKNGKPVRVPVPPMLAEYLRDRLPKGAAATDYVLKGRFPNKPISHATILKGLKALAEECELHVLTPHELRHTCAELWKAAGATTKDLQNLFNHSSESSTKRYEHKVDDRLNHISTAVARSGKGPKLSLAKA